MFDTTVDPDLGFQLLRQCVTELKAKHKKLLSEYLKEKTVIDEEVVEDSEEECQEYRKNSSSGDE